MSYPPPYPHDPIEEIGPDLFMVRGSLLLNPLMHISRNMAVIRHAGELTLVNPLRMGADGEADLKRLGTVKRILRLGSLHGLDDPYYVRELGAELWCQPGGTTYPEPAIDVPLDEASALPFPDARLFCFHGAVQPEGCLLIERGGGVLLTCDAIQHYGDYRHITLLARLMMPFIGFPKTTILGPIWLKVMTPDGGSLKGEFERLLAWRFDSLLAAHGSFLPTGAHDAVRAAVGRAYRAAG